MRHNFQTTLVVSLMTLSTVAQAKETWYPSRLAVHLHGGDREDMEPRVHLVANLNDDGLLDPSAYLGYGVKPMDWLDVEAAAGYAFGKVREPILALYVFPVYEGLKRHGAYSFTNLEYRFESQSAYWLTQLDYLVFDQMAVGIETENWGTIGQGSSWSYGVGPNMVIKPGKALTVLLELSVQARWEDSLKPEFNARFQYFF